MDMLLEFNYSAQTYHWCKMKLYEITLTSIKGPDGRKSCRRKDKNMSSCSRWLVIAAQTGAKTDLLTDVSSLLIQARFCRIGLVLVKTCRNTSSAATPKGK